MHARGKASIKSQHTGDSSRRSCAQHHALNCTKCVGSIANAIQKKQEMEKRLLIKREFCNKIKQLKGKNAGAARMAN